MKSYETFHGFYETGDRCMETGEFFFSHHSRAPGVVAGRPVPRCPMETAKPQAVSVKEGDEFPLCPWCKLPCTWAVALPEELPQPR